MPTRIQFDRSRRECTRQALQYEEDKPVAVYAQGMPIQSRLTECLQERILLIDGGMGTMIQSYGLKEADYRGERFAAWPSDLKGNNDLLVLTKPEGQ